VQGLGSGYPWKVAHERLAPQSTYALDHLNNRLLAHKEYIVQHGEDMPELRDWRWKSR
jgi:xylulose-5-phosphate/fructose-6-phosphate phosphoketolase